MRPVSHELREGPSELPEKIGREFLGNAEVFRRAIARHVVGAEDPIPEREEASEVLVPRGAIFRVVPPVEGRRDDKAAQRTEIPIKRCMHEDGVVGENRGDIERHERVEAQQQKRAALAEF